MIKRKFTKEEDSKICQLVNLYGAKNWDQIAKNIPGRTGRQCRDRYHNYLIPGYFNGEWSKEEDELLNEKVKIMGCQWSKMMKYFPRRSANSLRNRWNYYVCKSNNEINHNIDVNCSINVQKVEVIQSNQLLLSNIGIPEKTCMKIQNNQSLNVNYLNSNALPPHTDEKINSCVNVCTQTIESSFDTSNKKIESK